MAHVCPCGAADPVDVETGNFYEAATDINIPGRGFNLNVTRTYNSLAASTNGPFGYGWSSNLLMSLVENGADTQVTITDEGGSQVVFTLVGSTWTAPPRNVSTLTYSSGTWTYERWNGETFTFNSSGKLTSESDRNGNTTIFSYNGSGQLSTITDASGRSLSFTWTGSNITGISEPGSLSVSYGYTSGDLTSYTNQAGHTAYYTYDGSNNMLTVKDPNGNVLTNTYNGSDQVTKQVDALSRTTYFSYTQVSPNVTTTLVTDPNGNETLYTYLYGLEVQQTAAYGTALAATTSYLHDPYVLGVTDQVDPNGNLTTSTYDSNGNLLTTTTPLGETTTYTYNSLNEPLTKEDPLGVTTTYTYDSHGNLLTESTPLLNSSGGTIATQETQYGYGDPNVAVSSNGTVGLASASASLLPSGAAARTVSFWFNTSQTASQAFFTYGTKATDEWCALQVLDSGLQVDFSGYNDDYTWTLGSSITNGAWHHLVLVYNGATSVSLYMDGSLVSTATITAALNTVNSTLYIGTNKWTGTSDWDGSMQDFQIYSGTSTSGQPVVSYPMAERSADILYDVSGNGVNGLYGGSGITYGGTGASLGTNSNPGLPTTTTDPDGNVTTTLYDWYGNPIATTNALGNTSSATYNVLGEKTSTTPPDGTMGTVAANYTTTTTYDNLGNVLTVTQPSTLPVAWYRFGEASGTTMVDSSGNSVNGTYASSGLTLGVPGANPNDPETAVTDNGTVGVGSAPSTDLPAGAAARSISIWFKTTSSSSMMLYSYGSKVNDEWFAVELTDSGNQIAFNGYNDDHTFGLPYAVNDGNWHELTMSYNGSTTLTLYVDATVDQTTTLSSALNTTGSTLYVGTNTLSSSYDWNGSLNELAFWPGALSATNYTYDYDSNLLTTTDALGNETVTTYDADSEATEVQVKNVSGTVVRTTYTGYDSDGNVTSQKDGNGNTTTYGYNALNQQTSSENALSKTTTYTYDGDGNLLTVQDPNGHTTTNTYNGDSELTGVSYSDGTHNVTYTYDADGRRHTMVDGTGTSTWTYDSLGRLATYTNGNSQEVQYGYDIANNETSIEYPGGNTVTQTYNAGNEMATIKDWNSNQTTYTYDADGSITEEQLPNGVTDYYLYDNGENLMSIWDKTSSTTVFAADYTHNANDLINSDDSQPTSSAEYQFSALDQLCYAGTTQSGACSSPPPGATAYSYDTAGNLTSNNGTTQSYNAGDELCWSISGTSSNTCSSPPTGATTYSYDNNGNLTGMTPSSGSATTYTYNEPNELTEYQLGSTTPTTYAYDGTGLRMSKTTGSSTTQFTWDESGSLPLILQQTTGSSTTSFVYGPTGLPLEEVLPSGSTYYYAHDQQGSTRALTNSSGIVVNTDTYGPYGSITASTGSTSNPLLFDGQYLDSESGLYYLRARYYYPAIAQFISIDPMVQATQAPYAYATGDPINESDPSGKCVWIGCNVDTFLQGHGYCVETDSDCGSSLASETPGLDAASKAVYDWQAPSAGMAYKQTCFGYSVVSLCDTVTSDGSLYVAPGLSANPLTLSFSQSQARGVMAQGNVQDQCPSDIDSFVGGWSATSSFFLGTGGEIQATTMNGHVAYTGQIGLGFTGPQSTVSYAFGPGSGW